MEPALKAMQPEDEEISTHQEVIDDGSFPPFRSRLQAKREERQRLKQLQQQQDQSHASGGTIEIREPEELLSATQLDNPSVTTATTPKRGRPETSKKESQGMETAPNTHRSYLPTARDIMVGDEANTRRRQRADARRAVLAFGGSIWEAVESNALDIVENYFLLEGAHSLLRKRHPKSDQAGRTLLHCASWYGHYNMTQYLLSVGSDPNAIDTVVSKTTPLIEAARAGHSIVCVLLLQHGANLLHSDVHGDTALHWAARRRHGSVLLEVALEGERIHESSASMWFIKNLKGKTVIDLLRSSAFLIPLLEKRIGSSFMVDAPVDKRKSRFPIKAALMGANTRSFFVSRERALTPVEDTARPGTNGSTGRQSTPSMSTRSSTTPLSGVAELGLDVSSFTYKMRSEEANILCLTQVNPTPVMPLLDLQQSVSMDGFILTVASNSASKGKQQWQTLFVKADEISAKLIAFSDRSQSQVRWSLNLVGTDISTPVPGDPNFGINIDDTPYCFYVRETSASKDCTHYFSAADDATKKRWVKTLLQISREGPKTPRFAATQAENEFAFCARVVKFRPHPDGKHAEYMIHCTCQVFSKMVNRRLSKEWTVWHRFAEFDELHQQLQQSLGAQLNGVTFVKHKRDALRSVMGKALEPAFLEERRMQLDTFISQLCEIRTAGEFFKHHSDLHLKKFFNFEVYCKDVDQKPRIAKGSKGKGSRNNTQRSEGDRSHASTVTSRYSDADSVHSSRSSDPIEHSSYSSASDCSSIYAEDKKSRRGSKKKDKKERGKQLHLDERFAV